MYFADIAQQVERILGKDEVPGSNPGISSRKTPDFARNRAFFELFWPVLPAGRGSFLQSFLERQFLIVSIPDFVKPASSAIAC